METRRPYEIKTHPTFESLFPIHPALLEMIEQDMHQGTYDNSQPIILATWEGQPEPVCIDGHTRLRAAMNVGITEVPVFMHEFDTEDEALEKAIKLQRHRRNMSDAEILTCLGTLDKKRPRGGDHRCEAEKSKAPDGAIENSTEKSAKDTADLLGISTRKVERARTVLTKADPETVEAVKNSKTSINQAYEATQKKRRAQKAKSNSTAQNSKPDVTEDVEKQEPTITIPDSQVFAPVSISMDRYKSLFDLGGSIEDRLASAVDLYLESLQPEHRGFPGGTDQGSGQEESGEPVNDEVVEDDDDEYYFAPEDDDEE